MIEYHFRLLLSGPFSEQISDEDILDVTDALGEAGCNDCLVSVQDTKLELEFDRLDQSLQNAIASAIQDVEKAGYIVNSVLMERDAVLPVKSG